MEFIITERVYHLLRNITLLAGCMKMNTVVFLPSRLSMTYRKNWTQ